MQEHESEKLSKKLEEMLDPVIRPSGVRGPRLLKKGEERPNYKTKKEGTNYSADGMALAFVVPVLIMLMIFSQRGIFPFGESSFLRTDMYHQYAPFFSEFKHKLETGGSLFYSWDVGMGINFSALYAYYLASPLNWLILLCPKGLVIEFMTYMIVVKTGLCGLSFAWYLKKHCKSDSFGIVYFGIFYALSGYMAAYSWNIMWLDCILLLPVIMLGLERLVHEGKGLLYCVSLGISILSNYYISIMICIFMVIYFVCLLILEGSNHENARKGKRLLAFGRFAVYSLIAGGLAAVVLLPEICALQLTASGDFSFPKTFTSYFSIFDMIARHITNVQVEIGLDHWPNIYCGTAVLMFFLMYLGCRQIPVREKAVYCFLLLFFFASFSMNIPNFIWHGFHYPNSLPCRQSFIYIALMLTMCFRAFQYLKEITWKQVGTSFLGACIFVVLAEKLVESDQFHFIIFYLALIYLMFYVGFIYLYKRTKVGRASIAFYALLAVVVESTLNMAFTSITTTSRTSYVEQDANIETLIDGVMPSDDFFRVEKIDRKTKNDGAWEHFPSVSLFSSVANADLTKFFKYLGCESSTNAYSITGSTPLVDMLFSVRYALYEDVPEVPWKWEVASSGDMYLYENQYVLPLGFGVDTDFEEKWHYTLSNPAEVQNNLAEVYGVSPVLVEAEGENIGGDYRVEVQQDGEYYAYITNKKVDDVAALIGDNTKSFDNVKRGYLLELGECYERSTIMLDSPESKEDVTAHVYRVDEEALGELYSAMSREGWHLTEWRDTYLAGKITARKDRLLFTTIPYDTGWTVKVDGEEVETRKVVDTFLGFEIGAGEHEITMEYRPDGFLQGVWISVGSLILLLILAVAERMFQKDNNELDLEETDENSEKMSQGRGRKRGNYVQLRKIGRISSKDSTEGDRFEVWEEEGEQEKNPQSEEEGILEEDMLEEDTQEDILEEDILEEDTQEEDMLEENDELAEEKNELVIEDIGGKLSY